MELNPGHLNGIPIDLEHKTYQLSDFNCSNRYSLLAVIHLEIHVGGSASRDTHSQKSCESLRQKSEYSILAHFLYKMCCCVRRMSIAL